MEAKKAQLGFDSVALARAFSIERFEANESASVLDSWLNASYLLQPEEEKLLYDIHAKAQIEGDYWNEEELKINLIGFLFYLSQVEEPKRIKVFYERKLSARINGYSLSVIADCLIATPLFNAPGQPYFFLQEYKKSRGDKVDPEAQVLTAMLIAQAQNDNDQPIYGSYVLGTNLYFTLLRGRQYYHSRKYDLLRLDDLTQFVFSLRKLKELVLTV